MSKSMMGAAGGGLSAADKALLIPENIRTGVTIAKVTGTLYPSTPENSIVCNWARVYNNSWPLSATSNATAESPISIDGTTITVTRKFSAFVTKIPYKLQGGNYGTSTIPAGQQTFTPGQTFTVTVNPGQGSNNVSGITIMFAING